jgi:hypothetical protein
MTQLYSILVNSSDGYEDCWGPFFILLNKYWPDCTAKIYLNTQHKNWVTNSNNVTCTQVEKDKGRNLSWSECLLAALERIDTSLVLYFQEDYFIHREVDRGRIHQLCDYMIRHPEIGHIALTKHCSYGPYDPHSEACLQTIRKNARYRISTQAALWRVETLRSYLDPKENGWMFEIYGTWRARKRNDIFLSARWDKTCGGPVIDYLHTGIIKGGWFRDVEPVFSRNGIHVDFQKRGFYEPKHRLLHKIEVARKLIQSPGHLLKQLF